MVFMKFINVANKKLVFRYLKERHSEGMSPRTIALYWLQLGLFSNFIDKSLLDVSTTDVRNWLGAHPKDKQSTKENRLKSLGGFYRWAMDNRLVESNPCKKIKLLSVNRRLPRSLTVTELVQVRESCKTLRERTLVEFLYSTGARVSEISKIRIDEIDFANKRVFIVGKGNYERFLLFSTTAAFYIDKYLKTRKGECAFLFCTERSPHRQLSVHQIQYIVKNVGKRSGISKVLTPHVFRHTLATTLINNGANIYSVSKILGHQKVSTTQIYINVSPDNVRYEYDRFVIQ